MSSIAELIGDARERWQWIEDGDGDFDDWERAARMVIPLVDALEHALDAVDMVLNLAGDIGPEARRILLALEGGNRD